MSEEQKGARVLVVDDEEVVHASLRRILSKKGHEVVTVFSAREALDSLGGGQRFDIVITDLMMPGMNGIDLMQALRSQGVQAPVIMITGYPTIRTAVQAMRLGARDYISKPFTRKELLGPVLRALRQEEAAAALEAEPTADAPDPGSLLPGATVYLPHHSWARFEQDGHFSVGIEATFLGAVGRVVTIAAVDDVGLVEQGAVSLRLTNEAGEEHGVAMPLSGQVAAVNSEALANPGEVTADTWLLRVLPSHLDDEVGNLKLR